MSATTGYAQVLANCDQVFILAITRKDNTPFVTSVSALDDVPTVARRHKAKSTIVSHWRRDGDHFNWGINMPSRPEWKLAERFRL